MICVKSWPGPSSASAISSARTAVSADLPLPPLPNGDSRPDHMLEKPALNRFDALRRWRTETARTRGVDPDIVLPNSTLLTIAQHNPSSLEELAAVPELGAWKTENYGPQILATLVKAGVR